MTATVATAETSPEALAEMMVGREVLLRVDKSPARPGRVVLEVEDLRVRDASGVERLRGIGLTVRAGEILGVAGVAGNGQSQLLEVLGGITPATGRVRLMGEDLDLTGAHSDGRTRRRRGIAHVPEDRHRLGLILDFAAWENTAFGYHDRPEYARGPMMDQDALRADTRAKIERFDIRPADCWQRAASFSGGNQQKIVLAREIERDPALLLVGQPTRGVDIGAIEFIHERLVALRDAGRAILLVSVELDEILSLSDRIGRDVRRAHHGRARAVGDVGGRAGAADGGDGGGGPIPKIALRACRGRTAEDRRRPDFTRGLRCSTPPRTTCATFFAPPTRGASSCPISSEATSGATRTCAR